MKIIAAIILLFLPLFFHYRAYIREFNYHGKIEECDLCNTMSAIGTIIDRVSAELGNAEAQNEMVKYFTVYEKDDANRFKWALKSAEQGNVEGQYQLCMFSSYFNLPESEKETWCRKAANQGNANAQGLLCGIYYERGYYTEAHDMCSANAAAKYRDPSSSYILGIMYEEGKGVPLDYDKALKSYMKAADGYYGEYNSARYRLGLMYQEGKGVPRNYVTAYMWYLLYEGNDFKDEVRTQLANLEQDMTPEQIAKAKKQAIDKKKMWEKQDKDVQEKRFSSLKTGEIDKSK